MSQESQQKNSDDLRHSQELNEELKEEIHNKDLLIKESEAKLQAREMELNAREEEIAREKEESEALQKKLADLEQKFNE